MPIRPLSLALAALVYVVVVDIAAADDVFPSVRATPGITPSVREPSAVERTFGPPRVPGTEDRAEPAIEDRVRLRDPSGEAIGFGDATRSRRSVARGSDGKSVGLVVPNRSGGGVVRSTSGRSEGFVPSPVSPRGIGGSRR